MSAISTLRRILNGSPGSATDIDYNFQTVENYINADLIDRDGTVAMIAPLAGVDAVAETDLSTLRQVQGTIPTGTIWQFGGAAAPTGWALCNGQTQSSTDPEWVPLFEVIGYEYGQATTSFKLPDMRNKFARGASDPDVDRGATGGSDDLQEHNHSATFTGSALATHNHTVSGSTSIDHDHAGNTTVANGSSIAQMTAGGNYTSIPGGYEALTAAFRSGATDVTNWARGLRLKTLTVDIDNYNVGNRALSDGLAAQKSAGTPAGSVAVDDTGAGDGGNLPSYVTINYIIKK